MVEIYAESISAPEGNPPNLDREYVFIISGPDGDKYRVHARANVMDRFFLDCFEESRPIFYGLLQRDKSELAPMLRSGEICNTLRRLIP